MRVYNNLILKNYIVAANYGVGLVKFVADGMLGKLTRWLRMLGCDIKYSSSLDDKQLIHIAKTEYRILLTRDIELYRQCTTQEVPSFVVKGITEAEKLTNLAKRFNLNLEIDVTRSRCPKCNTKIKPILKDRAINKVPKRTFSTYEKFWECSGCGQIYWQGAHWKRIKKTLSEARKMLN